MQARRPRSPGGARGIRVRCAAAAAATLAVGVALQVPERTVLIDLLGSVLYVCLFAFLVRAVWPAMGAAASALSALVIACAVELLQLGDVPRRIVEAFPPARLLLGSAFDPVDLFGYAGGAMLAFTVQLALAGRPARPAPEPGSS
ncbi:DUF2809 domain-containing protein [Agromyces badenianii]|uniref:DUF2809 domain-containing protein n=1 Tax=Agromyces badenianii TaxID=2080742 RepID=A0A2S0WTD3_9MICO|nr:DUF2809 domain-containing protein [Agromyces badenianii]AWB94550.1 DUF2809 domain-containing protein [Agromyces badenianii]